jgi:N-acyl amino acid synthase of PEP-CTERM/exosortase system
MQMGLLPSNVTAFPFHRSVAPPWQYRFQTVLADTADARKISFRLRYQVFCDETGFEDPQSFPDKLEQDIFDSSATAFLVWDRLTEQWAGTMRLVDGRKAALPCETIALPKKLLGLERTRSSSVEFSRLCVPQEFRRIHSQTHYAKSSSGSNTPLKNVRQEDNEILLRTLIAFATWSQNNDVEYAYFLITAALARVLKRLHMPLTVAGEKVEHRGQRTPYMTHINDAARTMRDNLREWQRIEENSIPYVPYSAFSASPASPFGSPQNGCTQASSGNSRIRTGTV